MLLDVLDICEGTILRFLVVIILFQTVLIVFLLFKMTDLETQFNDVLSSQNHSQISLLNEHKENSYDDSNHEGNPSKYVVKLTDDFKNELKFTIQSLIKNDLSIAINNKQPRSMSNEDMMLYKEEADQRLDGFIAQGEVLESEMWKLESDIAKLDDKSRKEVLRKLAQSVNNGSLNVSR